MNVRRSIDDLTQIVILQFQMNHSLFIFTNKARNHI
ncbi:MAG: hypothetical protein KHX41_15195 [Coprobacillus cateniformis]|nr:hypothetical protein [Coprobacillus cateniformis]MVX26749.1 hypothetical protein [Coprobacillus cateniformis]RGY39965.1 hypothetical protein DXA41_18460 [Coprobacillus cateniformis]